MASPYLTQGGSSTSPYLAKTGYSSPYLTAPSSGAPAAPSSGSGGGLLGALEKYGASVADVATLGATSALGASSGYLPSTANVLGKVAGTAENIGTGTYVLGKEAVDPGHDTWANLGHQWAHALTTNPFAPTGIFGSKSINQDAFAKNIVSSAAPLAHPLRNPAQTALAVGLLGLPAVGSIAARAAYIADAADAARLASPTALTARVGEYGDTAGQVTLDGRVASAGQVKGAALKALNPLYKPPTAMRFLNVPARGGVEGSQFAPTANAARIGEYTRTGTADITRTPIQLQASGSNLVRAGQTVLDKALQRGLDTGIETGKYGPVGKLALKRVAGANEEASRITTNLRSVPGALASQAGARGPIRTALGGSAFDKGVSQDEGQLALLLRSQNVTGKEAADYWAGQAANGVNPKQTGFLANLASGLDQKNVLLVKNDGNIGVNADTFPKLGAAETAVSGAQAAREQIISDTNRMSATGMQSRLDLIAKQLGVEREGQGFVSLKTSAKLTPQSGIARAAGRVIPKPKGLALGQRATGEGFAAGEVPASTTSTVAEGLHAALRVLNTEDLRKRVSQFGSDQRGTNEDLLVADPGAEAHADVPAVYKQLLGLEHDTTLTPEQNAGVGRALQALFDDRIRNSDAKVGAQAPEGFKWVPKHALPDSLTTAVTARGGVEKAADSINSAVTAATVYLKLGHVPTRVFTNATTNLMEGSAAPNEILKSFKAVKALGGMGSKTVRELDALTGGHGYTALPHAGTSVAARVAGSGARFFARKFDAPFRLNSILYNLRSIGVETPDGIKAALNQLKDPTRTGMDAAKASRLDWAVRRSNRASIMYDGLSATEKRYVARYLWFYPWTKGAVRFAGHSLAEHPLKSYATIQTGRIGQRYQNQNLGNVPSYELGLTPLSGGANPLTANFSSYTPFSTVGTAAEVLAHPLNPDTGVASQLNPAYSGLLALATGKGLKGAAGQVLQPTPESQIVSGLTATQGKGFLPTSSKFLFGKTWQSGLARAIAGQGFPRPVNRSRLAIDYLHEHEKHRDIRIYTP